MTPFGTYLEALRRTRRVKQVELAEKLGVYQSYLSAVESGKRSPLTLDGIEVVTDALGLCKREKALLIQYAKQSIRVLRIPEDLPLEEYAVISQLKDSLGSLSKEQISVITTVLSMSDPVSRSFQQDKGKNM